MIDRQYSTIFSVSAHSTVGPRSFERLCSISRTFAFFEPHFSGPFRISEAVISFTIIINTHTHRRQACTHTHEKLYFSGSSRAKTASAHDIPSSSDMMARNGPSLMLSCLFAFVRPVCRSVFVGPLASAGQSIGCDRSGRGIVEAGNVQHVFVWFRLPSSIPQCFFLPFYFLLFRLLGHSGWCVSVNQPALFGPRVAVIGPIISLRLAMPIILGALYDCVIASK